MRARLASSCVVVDGARAPRQTRAVRSFVLRVDPVPCVVPARVFDAFGWCASDRLELLVPDASARGFDAEVSLEGALPERLLFVAHGDAGDLPLEHAYLHAPGVGFADERALAPWGIDAATDGLFERGRRPRDVFRLYADNLNALFWGLHDWTHFHNHGPFEERALTELQCDVTAFAWCVANAEVLAELGVTAERLDALREEATRAAHGRLVAEGVVETFDVPSLFSPRSSGTRCARSSPRGSRAARPHTGRPPLRR